MFERTLSLMEQAVAQKIFPSAALAIGARGQVMVCRCWGQTSLYPPSATVTPDTLYDMASLSKIIGTTMAALKLLEEGALSLNDTVGSFFAAPEEKRAITVRQLMTHTGGISAHFLLSDFGAAPADAAEIILKQPLTYAPGGEVVYSCMGYILLGKILERISGLSLDKLAERAVFRPLRMTDTVYGPVPSAACTELDPQTGNYLCGTVHDENARFLGGVSGNAGIFSSLNDMIKFVSMLACAGKTADGVYLSPAVYRLAIRNFTKGMAQSRGLGFQLAGDGSTFMGSLLSADSFGHTGFTGTSLAVEPESGLYIVLLTNRVHPTRDNREIIRFRALLHNCIASEYSTSQTIL